jgi:hypothetical protein
MIKILFTNYYIGKKTDLDKNNKDIPAEEKEKWEKEKKDSNQFKFRAIFSENFTKMADILKASETTVSLTNELLKELLTGIKETCDLQKISNQQNEKLFRIVHELTGTIRKEAHNSPRRNIEKPNVDDGSREFNSERAALELWRQLKSGGAFDAVTLHKLIKSNGYAFSEPISKSNQVFLQISYGSRIFLLPDFIYATPGELSEFYEIPTNENRSKTVGGISRVAFVENGKLIKGVVE